MTVASQLVDTSVLHKTRPKERRVVSDSVSVSIEEINPITAKRYLSRNTKNRPLKPHRIRLYATAMQRGDWHLAPDAIAFDENEVLLNGQNRLEAIIASQTTQRFLVVRGLARASFPELDGGQARDLADHLHTLGYPQRTAMAAVTLKLAGWVKAGRLTEYTVRGLSQQSGNVGATTMRQRIETAQEWDNDILEAIRTVAPYKREALMPESYMAFLRLLYASKWPGVDEFMQRALSGVGIVSPVDPAKALRTVLIRNAMTPKHEGRMPDEVMFAHAIIAANLTIKGAKRKVVKWIPTDEEPYPQPDVDSLEVFAEPFAWAARNSA